MSGWKIFTYAIRKLTDNLPDALRISVGPYLTQVAAQLYVVQKFGILGVPVEPEQMTMPDGFLGAMLLLMIVTLVSSLWIAVAWHRFVLLKEEPGAILPSWHGAEILRYFGWSIVIGLILALAGFLLGLVAGLVVIPLAASAPSIATIIMTIVVGGPVAILFYRFGLKLPAVATGHELSLGDAWARTENSIGTLLQLAVIAILGGLAVQLPSTLNPDPASTINVVYSLVVNWIVMMIGVSILTTLYSHFVDGNDLD